MSDAKIGMQKRLLGIDIMVKADDAGIGLLQKIDANEPEMTVKILEFITSMREKLSEKGYPDPLAFIEIHDDGSWSLSENQERVGKYAVPGYSYIRSQEEAGSPVNDQLHLLDFGIDFLKHDAEGNPHLAYKSLARFIELYTLSWAEGDARPDMERGQGTKEAASNGGTAKARLTAPRTNRIICEISELVEGGHTVARAAEIAYQRGFGTSKSANKQLYYRGLK